MHLSDKQIESLIESHHRQNIWVGAVRSGKTFACIRRFLSFITQAPDGAFVIAGKSERTVRQNIIDSIYDMIGSDCRYVQGTGEIYLFGRKGYVIGANDERAEQKIRGGTFCGALLDEITILPESFYRMLLSRLSIDGSKLFGTTNPDSPFHWLKKDFIDRADELDIAVFNFNLLDNPSLTQDYINSIQKEYTGLWYKRYIEGSWVQAEGAVFDHFSEDINVLDYIPDLANQYIVGIDYGTTNACAFVLIGHRPNHFPNIWLEREYYYDSRQVGRQKTDSEYADDFIQFITGYHVRSIYIDPSAASFRQELLRRGINNIREANNDVLPGIRFVSQLLLDGTYKICNQCTSSIKEFHTYVWDDRASSRGEDKPLKQNDHAIDAQRYALYTHFFNSYGCKGMTEHDAKRLENQYYYKG